MRRPGDAWRDAARQETHNVGGSTSSTLSAGAFTLCARSDRLRSSACQASWKTEQRCSPVNPRRSRSIRPVPGGPGELLGWRHDADGSCQVWVRVVLGGVEETAWTDLATLRLPERHLSSRRPRPVAAGRRRRRPTRPGPGRCGGPVPAPADPSATVQPADDPRALVAQDHPARRPAPRAGDRRHRARGVRAGPSPVEPVTSTSRRRRRTVRAAATAPRRIPGRRPHGRHRPVPRSFPATTPQPCRPGRPRALRPGPRAFPPCGGGTAGRRPRATSPTC